MKEFLLFHLYGPFAAWGDIAVGERRSSAGHPSKSAIIGLLAASMGIHRNEEAKHIALDESYGMAIRVNTPGELLRDYHTVQVPPAKKKHQFLTRKQEIESDDLHTILSQRDYRVDAAYTVALWPRTQKLPHSPEDLEGALKKPCFALYLGRKSCPLALPLQPQIIKAGTLKEAFEQFRWTFEELKQLPQSKLIRYYWEKTSSPELIGMKAEAVFSRWDKILSRRRWQFQQREEYYMSESIEEVAP